MNIQLPTNAVLTRLATLALLMLGSGCTPQPDQRPDAERIAGEHQELMKWRAYWTTPIYGEERSISGKVVYGREDTSIAVCAEPRSQCTVPINVDGSEQLCAVDLTEQASAQLEKFFRNKTRDEIIGEYWLEGKGRIAVFPGSFGRGGYTCQVSMRSMRVFEIGPPWFWRPPPRAN